MRSLTKLLYLSSLIFVLQLLLLYSTLKDMKYSQAVSNKIISIEKNLERIVGKREKDSSLKYILQWTSDRRDPFVYMAVGQQGFLNRGCKYTNCYVTSDRNYFGDVTKFDVIVFAGPQIAYWNVKNIIPKKRSPLQKYVFASKESPSNYPLCKNELNNFFNWTWTYRLDSDSQWGYIVVRDVNYTIIGPRTDIDWIKLEDMDPVSDEIKATLRNKTKAAAWFVSSCRTRGGREKFVKDLQKALEAYNLKVDVYGVCGRLKCHRANEKECFQLIKRDYYFYLSLENSISEDYVTEKLLPGLRNNAIPIVYGGANYTRFMPEGIYLNGAELGPVRLAQKMKYLIDNPKEYENYFRWTNHYSYFERWESAETDDYCRFCKILNNKHMMNITSIYKNFKQWWNDKDRCL